MQSFDWRLNAVQNSADSILASIGSFIAPLFTPLGFGDWRASTALITGITAKETVVSTLTVLTGAQSGAQLGQILGTIFTPLSAFSFLAFTVLYMPCVAAFAAERRELGSTRGALLASLYQTGAAYELTRLLLQMGLRRLAFMGGSMEYTVNQDRMQGYRQALAEYGAAPERGLIRTGVEARDQIPDALEGLLEQYPDCILCSDDTMALNVLADLNRRGIGVPAQLRLASFYDSESLLTASPPVTAAQFDAALLGSTACRLLMDFMAGKEVTARQVQGYQVVLRESTK